MGDERRIPMLTVTPPLFLIETSLICWWCFEPITVIAIVARRASILDEGDELPFGEDADEYLLLTHVESLPESLLAEIQVHAPKYSRSSASTDKRNYFSNICAHCNAVQEDRHVHGALDQGLLQTDEADSPTRRLIALVFAERFQMEASAGSNPYVSSLLQRHLGLPPH
jgi:hypothetical protein